MWRAYCSMMILIFYIQFSEISCSLISSVISKEIINLKGNLLIMLSNSISMVGFLSWVITLLQCYYCIGLKKKKNQIVKQSAAGVVGGVVRADRCEVSRHVLRKHAHKHTVRHSNQSPSPHQNATPWGRMFPSPGKDRNLKSYRDKVQKKSLLSADFTLSNTVFV